jgi:Flp pilus assembly protein TadD
MGKTSLARSIERLNPRRATAVSALALAFGLVACSGATPPTTQDATQAVKGEMLLKIADETNAGGDPTTAANLYRQLHDVSPQDPVPLARLAGALMALHDYRAAADAYRAALALAPEDADLHRGLALTLLTLGEPEPAMSEVRAALAKHADDPRLYSLLGVAEDMVGHHDLAQQSYRRGIELAPTSAALRNNYAMSLALAGNYADAVARLSEIAGPTTAPRYRLNLALA